MQNEEIFRLRQVAAEATRSLLALRDENLRLRRRTEQSSFVPA